MGNRLKQVGKAILVLAIPLGWWAYWAFVLEAEASPYEWPPSLLGAILLQSLVLWPLARGRPRSFAALLVPVAAIGVLLLTADFFLQAIVFPPDAWSILIVSVTLIGGLGYAGSLLLRNLPAWRHLQEMGLAGRTGLVVAAGLVLATSLMALYLGGGAMDDWLPVAALGLLALTAIPLWKPAASWWRSPPLVLALLVAGMVGVALSSVAIILYDNSDSVSPVGAVLAALPLVLTAKVLLALALAGLRFALQHLPRPQALRAAGLLDWRGGLFLAALVLALLLTMSYGLPAATQRPVLFMLFAAAAILYWQPAAGWRQEPQPARLFASATILAGGLCAVLFILGTLPPAPSEGLEGLPALLYTLYSTALLGSAALTLGCGLVALLPWLHTIWEEDLPGVRQRLSSPWLCLPALIPAVYLGNLFWYMWRQDRTAGLLWGHGAILLAAWLLTPRLARSRARPWLLGAALLLVLASLGGTVLLWQAGGWAELRAAVEPQQQQLGLLEPGWREQLGAYLRLLAWYGLLHLLAALGLALLARRPALLRSLLVLLLLLTTGLGFAGSSLDVLQAGTATAYLWLALLAAGGLLAPLLPARYARWSAFAWSGLLLLLIGILCLPFFFQEPGIVSYPLSAAIWAGRRGLGRENVLPVHLPAALILAASALAFAGLLRSGRAALALSRDAKPEAVPTGLLLLGACLALAASYTPSRNTAINRRSGEFWADTPRHEDLQGEYSQILADEKGVVWVGTDEGQVARSDGKGKAQAVPGGAVHTLYQDPPGLIWALTAKGVAGLDPDSGEVDQTYDQGELNLSREDSVSAIYQDSQRDVWLGTSTGLLQLEDRSLDKRVPRQEGGIQQIGEDYAGHLWYSTYRALYYSPPVTIDLVPRIGPATMLTYALDLTSIPAGGPVELRLGMWLSLRPESEQAGLVEISTDGGSSWSCLAVSGGLPPLSYPDLLPDGCRFTGSIKTAAVVSYDLGPYAGQALLLRLAYRAASPDPSPGSWYLLESSLLLQDGPRAIPFDAWSGEKEWASAQELGVVYAAYGPSALSHIAWDDEQGNVYQILSGDPSPGSVEIYRWTVEGWGQYSPPTSCKELDAAYQDSGGRIWLGCRGAPVQFYAEGQEWQTLDAPKLAGLESVAAIWQQKDGTLWFGGQSGQGKQRKYVVARYKPTPGYTYAEMYSTTEGLARGAARTFVGDEPGNIWVLLVDDTYAPNSPLWFLLPLLALAGLGYREYYLQPATHARRLRRRLQAKPGTTLPTLYGLLQTEAGAGDVLAQLAALAPPAAAAGWARLASALATVAPGAPQADAEALQALANELASTPEITYARELGTLYCILAEASSARTTSQTAAWSLEVVWGEADAPPVLAYQNLEPVTAPPFLDRSAIEVLDSLGQIADHLDRYAKVDASRDQLLYLAHAMTTAERAAQDAAALGPPEGPYLQAIVQNWYRAVQNELNRVSGRAELRLELRTRQVRRAAQVTLALRVNNVGRAVAENVVVSLQPGEGLAPVGRTEQRLERLSSEGSALAEFTILPGDVDTVRVACRVTWDDRVAQGRYLDFADVVRLYRTAEEFRPIPNPYIIGAPVKSPEMFHGREDVFRFVQDNLSGPVQDRTLVLHGQRRTGKTSVLYQLLGGRLGEGFVPVLVDMQELALLVDSTQDFLGELAFKIARAARRAGLAVKEPPAEEWTASPARAFNHFLDTLDEALGDQRVVVMLDEFEEIEKKITENRLDADLLTYLRSLMQHRDCLLFIFTGTHRLEEMSHDYWSILFNIALHRRISFLDQDDAARLIREPVASALAVDQLAVEKIVSLTRGHPYFVQLICWALVNQCNKQERNYATINDVNDAVQEILTTGDAHFAFIWQQRTQAEQLALAGLAHTLQPGKLWARPAEIQETLEAGGAIDVQRAVLAQALERLAAQEVLEIDKTGPLRYRFQIEVLRLWVEATKPVAAVVERER